jgi:hypothetical protein
MTVLPDTSIRFLIDKEWFPLVGGAWDETLDPADALGISAERLAVALLLALRKGLSRSVERSVKAIRGVVAVYGLKASRPEESSSRDRDLEVMCWEG